MNAPDKCPKCGLEIELDEFGKPYVSQRGQMYRCGTWLSLPSEEPDEDFHCLKRQRDQLAEEVARFRKDEWMPAACLYLLAKHGVQICSPQLLEAKARVEADSGAMRNANAELEQRVKELEEERNAWIEYASRLLAAGNKMRETTTAEVWENWDKAKQTIP